MKIDITYKRLLFLYTFIQLCLIHIIVAQEYRGIKPVSPTKTYAGKTYAIIIGISKYKNIVNLQYADRDAISFKNYLLNYYYNSVDSNNIELFLNEDAKLFKISDAISNILLEAKEGDHVYFYFAGHGDIEDLTQSKNGILLLYDSPNVNYFAFSQNILQVMQLKDYFGKLSQKGVDIIYIIDACHSGKLKGGTAGSLQTANAFFQDQFENSTKILSCKGDQVSLESIDWGGGRGLFSISLEEGLIGLADENGDGIINLFELRRYIEKQVYKISEGEQIPVADGDDKKVMNIAIQKYLDSVRLHKSKEVISFSDVNIKGIENSLVDRLDSIDKTIFNSFKRCLESKHLIDSGVDNALTLFKLFYSRNENNPLSFALKRNLAFSLNENFNSIVTPLILGKTPSHTLIQCKSALIELDTCLKLLGKYHYLYNSVLSRKYYIESLIESYNINLNNFDLNLKSKMLKTLDYLYNSITLEPNASYIYYSTGLTHQTMGNSDSALVYFKKYLSLIPNSFAAHNVLGIAYADMGRIDESINEFKIALQLDSNFISVYVNLGYVYQLTKKYNDAMYQLKHALQLNKNFISAHNNLGAVYFEIRKYEEAIQEWNISLELNPSSERILLPMAKAYYKIQNYQKAEEIINKIAIRKVDPEINHLLGLIFIEENELNDAIRCFNNSIQLDSTNSEYYKDLGLAYHRLGIDSQAQVNFNLGLKLSDNHYNSYERKADIYFIDKNDYSHAGVYYRKALLNDSLNIDLIEKYILNLFGEHKFEESEIYIKKLTSILPDDPEFYYLYACLFSLKNDTNIAIKNLEKAMKFKLRNSNKILTDPNLDSIRKSSKYSDFIKKYKIAN